MRTPAPKTPRKHTKLARRHRCVRKNRRTRPYGIKGFGAMHVTKEFACLWFGDSHGPKPYESIGYPKRILSHTPACRPPLQEAASPQGTQSRLAGQVRNRAQILAKPTQRSKVSCVFESGRKLSTLGGPSGPHASPKPTGKGGGRSPPTHSRGQGAVWTPKHLRFPTQLLKIRDCGAMGTIMKNDSTTTTTQEGATC